MGVQGVIDHRYHADLADERPADTPQNAGAEQNGECCEQTIGDIQPRPRGQTEREKDARRPPAARPFCEVVAQQADDAVRRKQDAGVSG